MNEEKMDGLWDVWYERNESVSKSEEVKLTPSNMRYGQEEDEDK